MFNSKRSRATYEADLHNGAAVHVAFGTPLPSLDADTRDDGSYIPLHKQEVRDDKGRRRLHGAFTGGWSAGYFNTVGSKEGWTPSTFVSSRTARRKDDPRAPDRRPEDYMDDEDLADAADTKEIRTTDPFGALGAPSPGQRLSGGLASLMRIQGETMGLKLLRKMGWKDGQGIGPRIRRVARLDISGGNTPHMAEKTHMFAPENINMVSFIQKSDQQGLGFNDDDARLSRGSGSGSAWEHYTASGNDRNEVTRAGSGIYEGEDDGRASGLNVLLGMSETRKSKRGQRGGLGVGVLNDTGSEEDDPYEMGPRISYNRVLGGGKTKKKKKLAATSVSANPSLGSTPVFVSSAVHATKSRGHGRCWNGKRPLNGFVPGQFTNSKSNGNSTDMYAPPSVPPEWAPSRSNSSLVSYTNRSTAEAAKAAKLDPITRAAILGELTLSGKSVFDYMSAASRERLAIASGKTDLPPAKGEAPIEARGPAEQQLQERIRTLPCLQKETALAAMSRGAGAGSPYANDDAKRGRYRLYLQSAAGFGGPPIKPSDMTDDDFVKEIGEFYGCAQLFKPMTGFMATRFTTASTGSKQLATSSGSELATDVGVRKVTAAPAHLDAAKEAARVGMYGRMTRLTEDFFPGRLLCKRFNVQPPAHVQSDFEPGVATATAASIMRSHSPLLPPSADKMDSSPGIRQETAAIIDLACSREATKPTLDLSRSEGSAKEVARSNDNVFKAIFGPQDDRNGKPVSARPSVPLSGGNRLSVEKRNAEEHPHVQEKAASASNVRGLSPPPQYPTSEASTSRPPPFSSLYGNFETSANTHHIYCDSSSAVPAAGSSVAAPAYAPTSSVISGDEPASSSFDQALTDTKRGLPQDKKGATASKDEDNEPPPAYSEGPSPLQSFTFLMATAGGASSIITQVQQGGPPINAIGDVGADETISMDLRGTRFVLSRDELLTLPEFVLLSLFPNGLFPEGHMGGFAEGDAVQVDYDPASLQYMLDFFRTVAQSIPAETSPSVAQEENASAADAMESRDDSSKRAGIIVLREDLDFYVIPPRADITQSEMLEVKRAAGKALLQQNGIFSGLKRSDEPGTTEAHLIEMLTAGGFNHDDSWGHRAGEPNKAVVCSLALARLRSDIRGNDMGSNAVGMAQKLLLFWRKPARRCWWEGVELENVEGVPGKLKVWIRRVWTLEMSVIGLR
ncbi:G patch domain-containing protein 1 [Colletotrichum gloeosporioides]|uniref:G patch domain-containing protein 1 n=1 Tax=Colletotrichum gloeosporioides TaxID=474922 RepID=A0A8H4FH63_COLGL|nr:G patch domain-containing protein 1 [Colletotrichum gloeosporioides]KAF3801681.1 G patch domain-containing protein 1 [Colletotrichum gloeosporioides]